MLYQLGNVTFQVVPFNADGVDGVVTASYVEHPVVGVRPPLEFTGAGPEPLRLQGKIFPAKFGGLADLEALKAMCRSGNAQFLMRGDGTPLGWMVIERVAERARYLDASGVGRVIAFDVSLRLAQAPSAAGVFNALVGIFT